MNSYTTKLLVTGMLSFGFATGYAQQGNNAAGGDATGSGGSVAYSVGEVVYTTNNGSTGSVSQGMQHSYEIITTNVLHSYPDISLQLYPNPTTDQLTLQLDVVSQLSLSYQLVDVHGTVLCSNTLTGMQSFISMAHLPAAVYLVNIIHDNQSIQSFKVIKH